MVLDVTPPGPGERDVGRHQPCSALLTDLYELTMAAAYFEHGPTGEALFELFVRELPPSRSFLVCAGLEQAVAYLEGLRFRPEEIDYLRSLDAFRGVCEEFWDYLAGFRFTGFAWAVAEGTVAFAGEPLISVRGPIIEAQIVETFLLTTVNFQTLVATKAARVVEAACADGKQRAVVDFGSRRAHGPEAGVLAARASYIGGCAATSNVEAGLRMGIPVSGTQAHSFIMAFDSEEEAFRDFYDTYGESSILLIDTYDTPAGARRAVRAAPKLRGVRIDSGDVTRLSRQVRAILAEAGRADGLIVASGDLDEYRIEELLQDGADVDAFGVGTALVTSNDAPALSGVYKLVAVERGGAWEPCVKLSPDKATYPGFKQVYRVRDEAGGSFKEDMLACADEEPPPQGEPLLQQVIADGRALGPPPGLGEIRARAAEQLRLLPARYRRLRDPDTYPMRISERLQQQQRALARRIEEGER
jgi:nicotinate phosphoribosyltransferase